MTENKKEYNLVAIHDYLLNIERELILVEKLIDELDYVSRTYWNENDRDLTNRKNRQFLISGKSTVDNNISDIWKNINWIRQELKINEDCCESEECKDD